MHVYHVEFFLLHVDFFLLAKHNGEEEGGDNAASHREVCVDDCPDLGIARGQTAIKTRPEQPQEQSAWVETVKLGEREGKHKTINSKKIFVSHFSH